MNVDDEVISLDKKLTKDQVRMHLLIYSKQDLKL